MQGYDADHKDIALLKLRNFILRRNISDEEITSENGLSIVAAIVEAIEPFVTSSGPCCGNLNPNLCVDYVSE